MNRPVVEAHALQRDFGATRAVRDLSLTLGAGAVHGFVGANGGGKTTALLMLAGVLAPSRGEARVLEIDLNTESRRHLRERVGFMTQDFSLFPDLTVRENLQFRAEVFALYRPKQAIARTLAAFRLDRLADTRAARLSGGWARRLHLAAVLMPAPALVLLDEPTAGLDVAARSETWNLLAAQARSGMTIILATHDLAEAERCDTISMFFDGAVTSAAAPSALISAAGLSSFTVGNDTDLESLMERGLLAGLALGATRRVVARQGSPAEAQFEARGARRLPVSLEDVTLARLHEQSSE